MESGSLDWRKDGHPTGVLFLIPLLKMCAWAQDLTSGRGIESRMRGWWSGWREREFRVSTPEDNGGRQSLTSFSISTWGLLSYYSWGTLWPLLRLNFATGQQLSIGICTGIVLWSYDLWRPLVSRSLFGDTYWKGWKSRPGKDTVGWHGIFFHTTLLFNHAYSTQTTP